MKFYRTATIFGLSLLLAGPIVAQQTNEQARKDAHADVKQQEKADKQQAKADKAERKALKSHKVKKAVREQDKADAKQPQ